MLKFERHQLILNKLKLDKKVLSTHLSNELNVSEDTIRRDLKELESKKLLFKVHGGALSLDSKIPSFEERSIADLDKKQKIAKKAVSLIVDGQVIIMSGSSTNVELAKIIPFDIKITIFTYSLPIAQQLMQHPTVEVIFLGGKLNKKAQVTTGIDVIKSITKLKADICFMGTDGIHPEAGLTESDWEVAHIKRTMIAASNYTVSMCVSRKLNMLKRYTVVPLEKINAIITEIDTTGSDFDSYRSKGVVLK